MLNAKVMRFLKGLNEQIYVTCQGRRQAAAWGGEVLCACVGGGGL